MPAYARREIVPADEVGVYHCTARCVRRAFLCGVNSYSGKNYEHRREWIRERIERLAAIFAIDVCGYAVMSNHIHLILRTRPDLVPEWSDEEVALRWKFLFPTSDPAKGSPSEPTDGDLNMTVPDPARVKLLRERLSSLSWFMRGLCEPIARRANKEDKCTGRFWEGRFGSQRLIDEGAILAGSIYVDLNPIRAGMAETPEDSEYTSAFDRTHALSNHGATDLEYTPSRPLDSSSIESSSVPEPNSQRRSDAWLCELTIDERPGNRADDSSPGETIAANVTRPGSTQSPKPAPTWSHGPRASNQGFLPVPLEQYLSLLDWTGRQFRGADKQTIPATLAPILERLGLNGDGWTETMHRFGRWFKTAVGCRDSLKDLAARRGKAWLHGQAGAALAFR